MTLMQCKGHHGFYIVIVFFLLDKGHEAENLQKECLFVLYYHFPKQDSTESFENEIGSQLSLDGRQVLLPHAHNIALK